jgi:hypothetical protein
MSARSTPKTALGGRRTVIVPCPRCGRAIEYIGAGAKPAIGRLCQDCEIALACTEERRQFQGWRQGKESA